MKNYYYVIINQNKVSTKHMISADVYQLLESNIKS